MDRWKSRGGKSERREGTKKEDQRRDRQKKEDEGARKGGKVAKHVFSNVLGLWRVENWLAKAARSPVAR